MSLSPIRARFDLTNRALRELLQSMTPFLMHEEWLAMERAVRVFDRELTPLMRDAMSREQMALDVREDLLALPVCPQGGVTHEP